MHKRPGRQQEDGLLALAVELIEDALTVALDEAFGVGVASTALLAVAPDDPTGRLVHDLNCGARLPRCVHGRASSTRLKGVSAARRTRLKPPSLSTSVRRCSPAWAPSARPTSWLSEAGVQSIVEPP